MTSCEVAYIPVNGVDYVITWAGDKFGAGHLDGRVKYMRVCPGHEEMRVLKTVIHWGGNARELYDLFVVDCFHVVCPGGAEMFLNDVLKAGKGVR